MICYIVYLSILSKSNWFLLSITMLQIQRYFFYRTLVVTPFFTFFDINNLRLFFNYVVFFLHECCFSLTIIPYILYTELYYLLPFLYFYEIINVCIFNQVFVNFKHVYCFSLTYYICCIYKSQKILFLALSSFILFKNLLFVWFA